jgi:hypothetical protein
MVMTIAMFAIAMFDGHFKKWAASNFTTKNLSHFSILLADIPNLDSFQRQMVKLPGVDSIDVIDQQTLKLHIEKNLAEIGELTPDTFLNTQYTGLKIYLSEGISRKSYELIKEYAARLAGNYKVDMTSIVQANTKNKASFKDNHLAALAMSVIFICWIFSLLVISPKLAQMSYVVEKYQRRNKVHFKSLLSITVMLFLFCISLAFVLDIRTINYLLLLAFAVGLVCVLTILTPKSRWRQ